MDCRRPGFSVHHQFPEFTQTHVHHIGDADQPPHTLSSPSPSTFSLFPSIRVFAHESILHIRWSKYIGVNSFSISPSNEYSGLISFRTDWLNLPKLGKEYIKAILCHPACLTYAEYIMQNVGLDEAQLESRLMGEMSVTSDMQRTSPLRQTVKKN